MSACAPAARDRANHPPSTETIHLSTFGGWTCIIDEVPNIWAHGETRSAASSRYLAFAYNFLPVEGTTWSQVQAKAGSALLTALHNDTLLSSDLAELHRLVRDRGVIANVHTWEDTADGKPWPWGDVDAGETGSVQASEPPRERLRAHLDLQALGQDVRRYGEAHLVPAPSRGITWRPGTLLIRYFARTHRAGTTFWQEDAHGRECLRRIRGRGQQVIDLSHGSAGGTLGRAPPVGATPPTRP